MRKAIKALGFTKGCPSLARHRLLHLRAQPTHLSPTPQAIDLIKSIREALKYEAEQGCPNVKGRTAVFSEHVASKFESLKDGSNVAEKKIELHKLARDFRRYDKKAPLDRASLLNRANSEVKGDMLEFGRLAAPPAPIQSQTQNDRRTSHSQASTSDAAPRLPASSPVEPERPVAAERSAVAAAAAVLNGAELEEAEAAGTSEDSDGNELRSRQEVQQEKQQIYLAAAMMFTQTQKEWQQLELDMAGGEQRTASWRAMRDSRLTASAFGNAIGFWNGGREQLWEEKLGLRPPFAGNEATAWGTRQEDNALQRYAQVTGHSVSQRTFQVLGQDHASSWLGASPDGLVEPVGGATSLRAPSPYSQPPKGKGPGVLEIKCPFNRGAPLKAQPHSPAPWYYMAQVQGLMEVFDREWCNVYSYTVNASSLQHIKRDRDYWRAAYDVLSDFWWGHIVPAKHALAAGNVQEARSYRPPEKHALTEELKARSKDMVLNSSAYYYPQQ